MRKTYARNRAHTRVGPATPVILGFALSCVAVGGCTQPSLLITPVSAKRELQETELWRDSFFAADKIALIDVSGVLMNTPRRELFGEGENPVSLLLEQLDKARRDGAVKAVILRINSPGGSVAAAELMHNEITHFRKTGKPVVAVMMDVGASGAYYLACSCDEIVAQHSTVTGSIGVIMQMFDVSGTMDKLGIQSEAITSGAFKDAGSIFRGMRPEEREMFQRIIQEMYGRFVDVVAAGRPSLDQAEVRKLADGRVYSAEQALEAGLIDRIAGLRDTVSALKQKVGASRIRLVTYHRPLEYRPNYYARASAGETEINLLSIKLDSWPSAMTPRFMYLWAPGLYPAGSN